MQQLATLSGSGVHRRQSTADSTKRQARELVAQIVDEYMGEAISCDLLFLWGLCGGPGHKVSLTPELRPEFRKAVRKYLMRKYRLMNEQLNQLVEIYREPDRGPQRARNKLVSYKAQ